MRISNSQLLRRRKAKQQQRRRAQPETTRQHTSFLPDIRGGVSTQRKSQAATARSPSNRRARGELQEQPAQQQQRRGRGDRGPRWRKQQRDRGVDDALMRDPSAHAPQHRKGSVRPVEGQRGTVHVRVRKPKPFCNYKKHNKRLQRSVKKGAYTNQRGLFPNAFPAAGGLIGDEPYVSAQERQRREQRQSVAKFVSGPFVVCDHTAAVSRREEKLRGQVQDAGPYIENPQFRDVHRGKWVTDKAWRGF